MIIIYLLSGLHILPQKSTLSRKTSQNYKLKTVSQKTYLKIIPIFLEPTFFVEFDKKLMLRCSTNNITKPPSILKASSKKVDYL